MVAIFALDLISAFIIYDFVGISEVCVLLAADILHKRLLFYLTVQFLLKSCGSLKQNPSFIYGRLQKRHSLRACGPFYCL